MDRIKIDIKNMDMDLIDLKDGYITMKKIDRLGNDIFISQNSTITKKSFYLSTIGEENMEISITNKKLKNITHEYPNYCVLQYMDDDGNWTDIIFTNCTNEKLSYLRKLLYG